MTCPASPDGLWNTRGGKLMLSKTQWIGYMHGEVVDIDEAAMWKIFTWPILTCNIYTHEISLGKPVSKG